MTIEEAIDQLEDLQGDRKSLLCGDDYYDNVLKTDIEALEIAISVLKGKTDD